MDKGGVITTWLDNDQPSEFVFTDTNGDRTSICRMIEVDFDYLMSYLLVMRDESGDESDKVVAVFVEHGKHPESGWRYHASELGVWSKEHGDKWGTFLYKTFKDFIDWTEARERDYHER